MGKNPIEIPPAQIRAGVGDLFCFPAGVERRLDFIRGTDVHPDIFHLSQPREHCGLAVGLESVEQSMADTRVFERAFIKALAEIDARPKWPSPVEVAHAYWEALRAERYDETAVLWPGSAAWREYYKNGTPTEYVFGKPQEQTGTKFVFVPYASRRHFETHGAYNLKMVLSNERIAKGRYYIVSGN